MAAGRDGTPLAVAIVLAPCAEALYDEARVWLGNETHQASRLHDGDTWSTSQHYAALSGFPRDGNAMIVPLQANPNAAHAPALITETESTTLWLRLRGANATSGVVALGTLQWVTGEHVQPHWSESDGPWVTWREAGTLIGAAPAGLDGDGHPLPAGFARLAVPPGNAVDSGPPVEAFDLLLVRIGPHLHEGGSMIEFLVQGEIYDLGGIRVESRTGALILPSMDVGPGTLVRIVESHDATVVPLDAQLPYTPTTTVTVGWGEPDDLPVSWDARGETTGRFNLAQSGGLVSLHYGDQTLDSFAYGDSEPPESWQGDPMEATRIDGRLFVREWDGGSPTQGADDWQRPRIHRQHQADHATQWFTVEGPVRAFLCPDRCHEEILKRIHEAETSIDVNLYELTLPSAVTALADAAGRGVEVRVLIHDRPVAASQAKMDRIAWSVDQLVDAGAQVHTLEGLRYDFNHAKYLIIDEAWTVVATENAVSRGWPPDGQSGNRGHGVAVHDPSLARWMQTLFEYDHLHPQDAIPVTGNDLHPDAQPIHPPAAVRNPPPAGTDRIPTLVLDGGFDVAPILAPDHLGDPVHNPIVMILGKAQHEIGLAQMNLPLSWSRPGYTKDSPLASALVDAAGADIRVTGTLASAFIRDPERDGNHRTAAALHVTDPRIDLRLGGTPHPDGVVHAKTWWTDPGAPYAVAITGSANGNLASQAMNRELNLMLASPDIAAYWAHVGAGDHQQAQDPAAFAPPRTELDDPEGAKREASLVGAPLLVVAILLLTRLARRATH